MACIVLGLEYCHTNKIIHRDIKPENLVLDKNGYVKVTDFGIAKIYEKENSSETSGTPGYMAPEVICGQNHTYAVDYFALGVIGYEFMKGVRPYLGKGRKKIKEKMLAIQARIIKNEIPPGWSIESADCINRLLERKATNRLGYLGATEVKEHSWFKYYPWKDLYLGKMESPFLPGGGDNFEASYCSKPEAVGEETKDRYIKIVNGSSYKNVFKNFKYFNRDDENKDINNNIISNNTKNNGSENKIENYKDKNGKKNKNNIDKNIFGIDKKFINPHLVYYEGEGEGEDESNINDFDASIINRNILSNKSTEDTENKKKQKSLTSYQLFGKREKCEFGKYHNSLIINNKFLDSSLNKGKIKGIEDLNNSLSFRSSKIGTKSKASGFGY